MSDIESLLSQFRKGNNQSEPVVWGDANDPQETKVTPADEDGDRLEQSIREIFSNKQLLNKALFTFLGVFTANGGVSLMTNLGIGAIASGTLGSIVLGLFFANTLTKIQYDGRIHIQQDFLVAAAQTTSVGVALWIAFDEYRAVSDASKIGKERFYQEVKDYEIKAVPATDTPWLVVVGLAFGLLAFATVLRRRK